jgi:hypothetical protein
MSTGQSNTSYVVLWTPPNGEPRRCEDYDGRSEFSEWLDAYRCLRIMHDNWGPEYKHEYVLAEARTVTQV